MPLGWHISVYRQQNDGAEPAVFGAPHGTRLAVWQAGINGLRWLRVLVEQGKVVDLGGNGYPREYTATAAHIVPALRDDPPEVRHVWLHDPGDFLTEKWLGETTKDPAASRSQSVVSSQVFFPTPRRSCWRSCLSSHRQSALSPTVSTLERPKFMNFQ